MNIEKQIVDEIKSYVKVDELERFLETPPNPEFGDISSILAFSLAKEQKKPPIKIAEEIVKNIKLPERSFFSKVEPKGGYINFFYNYRKIADLLIPSVDHTYGSSEVGKGKKVMVEHTSVNPNKAFHIGHTRNCCLGDSLARILRFSGYDVQVANYIDDTGSQVADSIVGFKFLGFPLAKEGVKFDQYCGDEVYVSVNKMYEKNPELEEKRKFVLKEIEKGDSEIAIFARELVEKILKSQLQTAWKLNVFYDLLNHESHILKYKFWDIAFEKLKKEGYANLEGYGINEGCWVLKLSQFPQFRGMVNPDKVLVRSDGTVVYAAKDIAYAMWKHGLLGQDFRYAKFIDQPNGNILWTTTLEEGETNYPSFGNVDLSVNVIGAEQSYEQEVVHTALDLLSEEKKRYIHFGYGKVSLSKNTAKQLDVDIGEKSFVHMSGRKGLYVNADTVLDALTKKAYEESKKRNPSASEDWLKKTAERIAVAAFRYEMVKSDAPKMLVFDLDRSLKLEGDTGPYLQYTYARASSILRKAKKWEYESTKVLSEHEKRVIKNIMKFPTLVQEATENLKPSQICIYANELATDFNSFYQYYPVLKAENKNLRNFRLGLVDATRTTLGNSLYLIGIDALEKM
jgi:arginyl-tRNA synthetase